MIWVLLGLLIGLYLGYKTVTKPPTQPPKPPKPPKKPQPPPKPPIGRVPPPPPISPKTTKQEKATLIVTVIRPWGGYARGAILTLCGGKPYKCYKDVTGSDGKAVFQGIPYGTYTISVRWGYIIIEPGVIKVKVDKPLVEKTIKLP